MDVNQEMRAAYLTKLRNQFYGLLCEREKDGQWEKFLDTIYIELMDTSAELRSINYESLMRKVGNLRFLSYPYFRRTILDIMNLIGKIDLK